MSKANLQGKIILVVDDEELLQEILKDSLEAVGAKVFCAGNYKSGLELAMTSKANVVISDFRMPSGDGLSLLKEIRNKLGGNVKLFLCTGLPEENMEQEVKNSNLQGIFPKPYEIQEMIRILAKD